MRHLLPSLLALALLAPANALAADSWATPHPGVRYLERSTSEPNRIRAVEVDLCAAGVSIRATKSGERRRTPSSFGESVGAHVVVNGDFFSYADYSTIGLAIGDGARWSGSTDGPGSGFVAFGPGRAVVQPLRDDVASPPAWMKDVVSGKPQIVTNGQVIADGSSEFCLTRHPRTAAGLSRDGKKLILAVVDGRSSTSRGMRCSELGTLMKGLGAHNALNLDGGGSSAMWVRGKGVVNRPSDGSQRVVANHLAIIAKGTGAPEACGGADAELVRDQIAYWAPSSTTDVDADGRADVCGRGPDGVVCWPMSAAGAGMKIDGPALSDDSGWSDEQYYSTMTLTDINGDQRDDLCVRASAGIRCYPSRGDSFGAAISGPALGAAWAEPRYYGTLRWGDVTGDGKADVCGRDADGVRCWPSTGTGFGAAIQGPRWSDATGWDKPQHWSTLRLADVNGDGKMDVCARAGAGIRCVLSEGTRFGDTITGPLADASGWTDLTNYGTIRFGDINGDGKDDLCARANARFVCWPSTGAGFGAIIDGPAWSDADGWTDPSRWGTVQLADVNGDGKQDVCGRAPSGVECWLSNGRGFPTKVSGPAWGGSGWAGASRYSTLRVSGPRCIAADAEVCGNGADDDCDGQIDEGCPAPDMGMMEPDMAPDDMAPDLGQAEEPDMAEVADLGPDSGEAPGQDMSTPDEDLSNSGERPDGELISTSETSSCVCAAPGAGAPSAPGAAWMLALAAAGLWRRRR